MNLFKIAFRRGIGEMITWSIIVGGLLAIAMFFYPSLGTENIANALVERVTALPHIIVQIFDLEALGGIVAITHYFAYFFQFAIVLSMLYAAILGAKTLASEEGSGAIEFLFAQPITRKSIARQKLIAAIFHYLIYCVIVSAISMAMLIILDDEEGLKNLIFAMVPMSGGLFFSGLIYLCIGFFFSSFLRSNGEAIPIVLALTVISIIIGFMGKIVTKFAFLEYISPIFYAAPNNMMNHDISVIQIIIGIAIIVLTIFGGRLIYKKKNFAN
ncbi:MAG: ABC transporter permease subunit [Bacillota bacterium]|nr:ABC transporter permease subunit [Bacillota bacterium]